MRFKIAKICSVSEHSFLQLVLRMVDIVSKLTMIGPMAFGQACFGWHMSGSHQEKFRLLAMENIDAFNND